MGANAPGGVWGTVPRSQLHPPCQGWKEKPNQGEEIGRHASPSDQSPAPKTTVMLTRLPPKKFTFLPKSYPEYNLIITGEPFTWPILCLALTGLF